MIPSFNGTEWATARVVSKSPTWKRGKGCKSNFFLERLELQMPGTLVNFYNTLKWINRVHNFSILSNRDMRSISSGENGHFWLFSRQLVWQNGHIIVLPGNHFYTCFSTNLKLWYIIRVGVNKALTFLSTFILYILFIVLWQANASSS